MTSSTGAALHLATAAALLYGALLGLAMVIRHRTFDRLAWRWLLLGSLYAGIGTLVLYLPTLAALRIDTWNWQGKLVQLMLALSSMTLLGVQGVVGEGRPSSWFSWSSMGLCAAIVALGYLSHLAFGDGAQEKHWLVYQLTMPGLAEETLYRGTLLTLAVRALDAGTRGRMALMPYTIVTVSFCVLHGFYPEHGRIAVDWLGMASPLVIGTLLGCLRYTSRSIVPCIVAHNLFNAI